MLPFVTLFIPRHDFIQRICIDAQFDFVDDDIIKKKSIDNKKGGSDMFNEMMAMKVMLPRLATLHCFKFPSKTSFNPEKV